MYFMLTMVVFLSPRVAGHRALIMGVRNSFEVVPLLSAGMSRSLLDTLVGIFQSSAALAIQLAAPMLMTMLIVDLALGCIGKAMPQMNVMAMGLSIRAVLGVVVWVLGLQVTGNLLRGIHLGWGQEAFNLWSTPQTVTQ